MRAFSFGGGVQSMAALVLQVQGRIDYDVFLFSNVGDDSEHPDTLKYFSDVAMPYAEANGVKLIELRHIRRDGEEETLYKKLTRPGSRSTGIPIYLEGSGAPGRRSCTSQFKIRRIAVWQRRHGATRANPAVCGLGISLDEFQRMRTDSGIPTQVLEYPLINLRLTRKDCVNIIKSAGLPVPPKSACWFCPFHSKAAWHRLKVDNPDLFQKAVELEKILGDRSESLPRTVKTYTENDEGEIEIKSTELASRGRVYLTRELRPLDRVIGDQRDLFHRKFDSGEWVYSSDLPLPPDDDSGDICESGYCMT